MTSKYAWKIKNVFQNISKPCLGGTHAYSGKMELQSDGMATGPKDLSCESRSLWTVWFTYTIKKP